MSDTQRDPRVDPKLGDILRLIEGLTIEIVTITNLRVFFIVLEEIAGLPRACQRRGWRKFTKGSEVISRGE